MAAVPNHNKVACSRELSDPVIADYDATDTALGIEFVAKQIEPIDAYREGPQGELQAPAVATQISS